MKTNKPIIIAFCGKSAVGKDVTATRLDFLLSMYKNDCKKLVSDTTRRPRANEKDGVDYNFITTPQFLEKRAEKQYLEWTVFNGWYYGTLKNQVTSSINIGVFNPQGLEWLALRKDYIVIPILLEENFIKRLYFSYLREGRWSWEYFKRIWRDFKNFLGVKKFIAQNFSYRLVLKNYNPFADSLDQNNKIYSYLIKHKLAEPGKIGKKCIKN